jgi:hypothetical protein
MRQMQRRPFRHPVTKSRDDFRAQCKKTDARVRAHTCVAYSPAPTSCTSLSESVRLAVHKRCGVLTQGCTLGLSSPLPPQEQQRLGLSCSPGDARTPAHARSSTSLAAHSARARVHPELALPRPCFAKPARSSSSSTPPPTAPGSLYSCPVVYVMNLRSYRPPHEPHAIQSARWLAASLLILCSLMPRSTDCPLSLHGTSPCALPHPPMPAPARSTSVRADPLKTRGLRSHVATNTIVADGRQRAYRRRCCPTARVLG